MCPPDARKAEPPKPDERERSTLEDILNMIQWALLAALITMVFGIVLNVLEAVL